MSTRSKILTGVLALGALAGSMKAEDAPKWYDTLTLSGFADAYYKYNANGIQGGGSGLSTFEARQNMFDVAGGKLTVKNADGLVDLYFGNYATVLSGNVAAAGTTYNTPIIGQAYINQAFGPVTVTLGQFATHVGYEVTDSVANYNYTRALLYGAVPFFHTGVKFNYAPMEGLGLMFELDNGSSVIKKANQTSGAGFQVSYTGIAGLALYGNYYYDQYVLGAYPTEVWESMHYFDFVTTYKLNDSLDFAGEYLYITNKAAGDTDTAGNAVGSSMAEGSKLVPYSPKKQGYALYVNYVTPVEGLAVTPRFEQFFSPDAFETQYDYTLTARYTKGVVTNWLEYSSDVKTSGTFAQAPKDAAAGATEIPQSEQTLTWGVGVKF